MGVCRYGNNSYDYIRTANVSSVHECMEDCKSTNGCVAYAYSSTRDFCGLYRGGPYTYGSGDTSYMCYVVTGILMFIVLFYILVICHDIS